MRAARLTAYASTTHCKPVRLASSSCWMLGSATFTIVMSTSSMNVVAQTATSVQRRPAATPSTAAMLRVGSFCRLSEQDGADGHGAERKHAEHAERAVGNGLVQHDRARGDRDGIREQRREPGDGECSAGLIADLQQRGPGCVADDQRDEERPPHTALRRHLRRYVADREEQTAREAVHDGDPPEPLADRHQDERHACRDREPEQDRAGRAVSTAAAAARQRDAERNEAEHREQDSADLATAEPTACNAR